MQVLVQADAIVPWTGCMMRAKNEHHVSLFSTSATSDCLKRQCSVAKSYISS